ncbi:hypothetical protein ABIA69_004550 [Lysinibacillus parviboronicapiens]|uniref:Uncharacterized protein n=1 Tax=Lysinibacillus parviboronicapiens TaxID=436516 RepID=A0ABV2PQX3_9BACI
MGEKAKISQKVVEAYRELLDKHEGNSLAAVYEWSEKILPHKTDSVLKDVDWFTFLALMTDGYDVIELTPEEKITEKLNGEIVSSMDSAFQEGIYYTLNTLGIKIKGGE